MGSPRLLTAREVAAIWGMTYRGARSRLHRLDVPVRGQRPPGPRGGYPANLYHPRDVAKAAPRLRCPTCGTGIAGRKPIEVRQ